MPATRPLPLPDTYFKLVRRFPLVRVADDGHLAEALAVIDGLLAQKLDMGGEAYVDALTSLVHDYESAHYPVPAATPADVLRELIDANGFTGAEVGRRCGIAASTVSALLAGKRRPTPEQAAALAALFRVSPVAFLPPARSV